MAETQPIEEKEPNLYNAKKSWHTPDKPVQGDASGLFFAPTEEQATPSDQEDTESPPAKSKRVNYKKRYDDLKKHYDSRLSEFKQREEELLAEAAVKSPGYKAPKTLEELQDFKKKNPDLYETVESVAHLQSEKQVGEVKAQLSAIQRRESDLLKREALSELKTAHPDFEDIRGSEDFHEWAKDQPQEIQQWVYSNNHNASLAGRAIDLYKLEKGVQSPQKQSKSRRTGSAADMVSTKTTAVDAKAPKVWTEREIARMSIDDFDKYQDDIQEALSEGRIVK